VILWNTLCSNRVERITYYEVHYTTTYIIYNINERTYAPSNPWTWTNEGMGWDIMSQWVLSKSYARGNLGGKPMVATCVQYNRLVVIRAWNHAYLKRSCIPRSSSLVTKLESYNFISIAYHGVTYNYLSWFYGVYRVE